MHAPHVADVKGREQLRQDLIAEVRRIGGIAADDDTIEDLKKKLAAYNRETPQILQRPEPLSVRRKIRKG